MQGKRKGKAFNPCAGASLEQGTKMAALMQVAFTFVYVLHGGYLCIAGGKEDYSLIYGMLYIVSGISFFSLAYLLYTTVDQPSMSCFRWWVISSSLTQITVIIATIGRNVIKEKVLWSVNIWMFCGFLIQLYLTWIVLAYMKYGDDEDVDDTDEENAWMKPPEAKPNPTPAPTPLPPPAASTSPPENDADDDNDQNDKDTVIVESADETENAVVILKKTSDDETQNEVANANSNRHEEKSVSNAKEKEEKSAADSDTKTVADTTKEEVETAADPPKQEETVPVTVVTTSAGNSGPDSPENNQDGTAV